MCLDQPGRRSIQMHRLVLLVAGVLIEGEKVLPAFRALDELEKEVLPKSGMLDEVERMVLSSITLAGSWCSLDPFS